MRHRKNRLRSARERAMGCPEISLTPLIDTVLVLLIVFMITAPIMYNAINLELPSSSTNDDKSDKSEAVVVDIDKEQKIYINGTMVDKERFVEQLEKKFVDAKERAVFVHADKAIPYGTVIKVVDDIKFLGGVKYVALATNDA